MGVNCHISDKKLLHLSMQETVRSERCFCCKQATLSAGGGCRVPFEGDNMLELRNKVCSCSYRPITPGKYSPELIDLVSKLLVLNPHKRCAAVPSTANLALAKQPTSVRAWVIARPECMQMGV